MDETGSKESPSAGGGKEKGKLIGRRPSPSQGAKRNIKRNGSERVYGKSSKKKMSSAGEESPARRGRPSPRVPKKKRDCTSQKKINSSERTDRYKGEEKHERHVPWSTTPGPKKI